MLGPDLSKGVSLLDVPAEGFLAGHVNGDPVLLSNLGDGIYAVSAQCTHYGGPLSEGLVVGETVRCPWHHACFSLRSGAPLKAPAFDGLQLWKVEVDGDAVFVRAKIERKARRVTLVEAHPDNIVIIGGGAAGFAAAEMLRRSSYRGKLAILSDDSSPPCDRPNLSKDYLAGTASEDWIPLKPPDFYKSEGIDLHLDTTVSRIDIERRKVVTDEGIAYSFDRLLLATGAEPVRLQTPGFDLANVHTLRSLADANRIIESSKHAATAAVIGASFIGLEVAAALTQRGLKVHVVAPEQVPMAKVLGPELGTFVRELHEAHGVKFHLGHTAGGYDGKRLILDDFGVIFADLLIVGVGVKPRTELAAAAGVCADNGILVDEYLETNVPGIFAAGDVANYPQSSNKERVRIEHWVVAERQGQTAALNLLGHRHRYADVPFFWSRHYDTSIQYVGHAGDWNETVVSGSISARDFTIRYCKDGSSQAMASIGRPLDSMIEEARLETELAGPSPR
jgi:NADPH-dependent 2,4-dienoyl-CoA reductase/sulfur reductase-like enzyme/nitrite reductase/ring-hydroxylating ferredoxin subunit